MQSMSSERLCKWHPTDMKLQASGECPKHSTLGEPCSMAEGSPWHPRGPAQVSHLKSPTAEAPLAMHECCGKHLKMKFPITAGISGVSCCCLQLSLGRPVTTLSSKAELGPCHWGGGNRIFSRSQYHSGSLLPFLGRIPLSWLRLIPGKIQKPF